MEIYFRKQQLHKKLRLCVTILLLLFSNTKIKCQSSPLFPAEFYRLSYDKAKMSFLKRVINDSINEGQLTHVYAWADTGFHYADRLRADSLKGYFLFYKGKSFEYYQYNNDSAIYYYKTALPFFPVLLNVTRITAVREIMSCYSESGNRDSTFTYVDSVKNIMSALPDTSRQKIKLSEIIATVYSGFGMYKTSISYYQFAVNGCMHNNNKRGLGMVLANLALVYEALEDNSKALQLSKEAAGYLQDVRNPLATIYSNIASNYYNLAQFDSARAYISKSNEIAKETGITQVLNLNDNTLAEIFIVEKKYKQAEMILQKTLAFFEQIDDPGNLIKTLLTRSRLDTALNNYKASQKNLEQALYLGRKNNFLLYQAMALQSLTALAESQKDYKSALGYQSDFMKAKDSMANEKTRNELYDLEINYRTQQKEQQIQLLMKDNSIKELQLQSSRRDTFFYVVLLSLVIIILLITFYQRNLRHKIMVQKTKAELQTQVLRSQMNPHFIFNSLNSIENFVMQNEKRHASDYLNKFSRLIRSILDSSRNELVPVVKDVESLKLYVELEQLRFNNRFSYNTYVDPELINGDYQVPSLLIQPYVENSIIHGLAHSDKTDLNLTVSAELDKGYIKYTMQDNGIGRKKAAEYNQYNKPHHKSVGLKITEDRICIFNEAHGVPGMRPVITDLWDEKGNPAGTRVEIRIKAA